jgi:ribosomal protein L37AE/L43A
VASDDLFELHLQRMELATIRRYTSGQMPEWISANTYIQGKSYSFLDHEYQEKILRDEAVETVVQKCSQVGISEVSARKALARCAMNRGYTVAYTLPTAGFAGTFMRTRIDPVIDGSPLLSSMVHKTTDNSEVKRFGDSYLYLRGAQSSNAPISIPVDELIHDELDFSDSEVVSQYHSRLTHSKYKRKSKFSTPTIPNRGINKEFMNSKRHFNMVKCEHCNHYFLPGYHEHVRIPGAETLELRTLTKATLKFYDFRNAYIECPKCKKAPSLQIQHRHWVCENADENLIANGYQVSPFDAPNIITPGYLIESSVAYKRYVDFENFGLGLPAEDKESTLMKEELLNLFVSFGGASYGTYFMGIDMGLTCHVIVGFKAPDGRLIIVHKERVPASKIRARRKELYKQFRPRVTVVDSLPYTETVIAMQAEDKNLYGAVYSRNKGLELYSVTKKDEKEQKEKGMDQVRQVTINRDKAFDSLMDDLRGQLILVADGVESEEAKHWVEQLCDMKRIREFNSDGELGFTWKKSEEGNDHYHHATLYMVTASQMLGVAGKSILIPFGATKFNTRPQK